MFKDLKRRSCVAPSFYSEQNLRAKKTRDFVKQSRGATDRDEELTFITLEYSQFFFKVRYVSVIELVKQRKHFVLIR